MRKRNFIIACVSLFLALVAPVSTLAATHEVSDAEELYEAISSDSDADVTVVLKADINLDGDALYSLEGQTITIDGKTYVLSNVYVVGDGDVIIDGNVTGEYCGLATDGKGNVTVNGDITSEGEGVIVYGSNVTVNGNVNANDVAVGVIGEGKVTVNGNVTGDTGVSGQNYMPAYAYTGDSDEKAEIEITVNGDVTATYGTGVEVSDGAVVTVNGNVTGGSGNAPDADGNLNDGNYNEPGGYSDGSSGVFASNGAVVTVNGNITGGNGYGTYAGSGSGIEASDGAVVTVNGNVTAGDVIANPEVGGDTYNTGSGIVMTYDSTVIVNGNVTGGNTSAQNGKAGSGAYIILSLDYYYNYGDESDEAPLPGELYVSGTLKGGNATANGGVSGEGIYFEEDGNLDYVPVEGTKEDYLMKVEYFEDVLEDIFGFAYDYGAVGITYFAEDLGLSPEITEAYLNQYFDLIVNDVFSLIEYDPFTETPEVGFAKLEEASKDVVDTFAKTAVDGYNEIIEAMSEEMVFAEFEGITLPGITVYEVVGGEDADITEGSYEDDVIDAAIEKYYNYIIKTEVIGNGSVAVSKEVAKEGEIIEVTCSAASGYVLESVTVHGEKIEAVDGVYTFKVAKGGDHTVVATFKAKTAPGTGDVTNVGALLSLLMMSGSVLLIRKRRS